MGRCVWGHRSAETLSVRPSQFSGDGFLLPPVSEVLSHVPATTSLQECYVFLLKNEVAQRLSEGCMVVVGAQRCLQAVMLCLETALCPLL